MSFGVLGNCFFPFIHYDLYDKWISPRNENSAKPSTEICNPVAMVLEMKSEVKILIRK